MRNIFFLTRTYPPEYDGGGSLMRFCYVQVLRDNKFKTKVEIIRPFGENLPEFLNIFKKIIKYLQIRALSILERLGFLSDYLIPFVYLKYFKLRKIVKTNDIIISTTGGELGCVILGDMLKKNTGAKHYIHFHDPINYGIDLGSKKNKKFHVGRAEKQIALMSNADLLIFTSKKHSEKVKKLKLNVNQIVQYLGFVSNRHYSHFNNLFNNNKKNIKMISQKKKIINNLEVRLKKIKKIYPKSLLLFYGGSSSSSQDIEKFFEVIKTFSSKEINLIVFTKKKPLIEPDTKNIFFENYISPKQYLKLIKKYADVGVVSLSGEYLTHCLPGKIFDFMKYRKFIIGYHLKKSEIENVVKKYKFGGMIYNNESTNKQRKKLKIIYKKLINSKKSKLVNYKWSMLKTNIKLIKKLKI
jgi:hypothetical protein